MALEYYSFNQTLNELQLEENDLLQLVNKGDIPAFRDKDKMKFKKEDVEYVKRRGNNHRNKNNNDIIQLAIQTTDNKIKYTESSLANHGSEDTTEMVNINNIDPIVERTSTVNIALEQFVKIKWLNVYVIDANAFKKIRKKLIKIIAGYYKKTCAKQYSEDTLIKLLYELMSKLASELIQFTNDIQAQNVVKRLTDYAAKHDDVNTQAETMEYNVNLCDYITRKKRLSKKHLVAAIVGHFDKLYKELKIKAKEHKDNKCNLKQLIDNFFIKLSIFVVQRVKR